MKILRSFHLAVVLVLTQVATPAFLAGDPYALSAKTFDEIRRANERQAYLDAARARAKADKAKAAAEWESMKMKDLVRKRSAGSFSTMSTSARG